MKKLTSIILAMLLAALLCTGALADDCPEPEGGKKFDSSWAIGGGLVEINYEEEGYRVYIHIFDNESKGTEWEYNCLYNEKKDALVSMSSVKTSYTLNPETNDQIFAEPDHEGFDDPGQESVFTINENGKLIWQDGRENAGADLEFQNIGSFQGFWRNEAEQIWADINWNGMDQEQFNYTVFIHRGEGKTYVEFNLTGLYDPDAGKLMAKGTCTVWTRNADGGYDPDEDAETYDATLSMAGPGKILYETANGIELTYDILASQPNG